MLLFHNFKIDKDEKISAITIPYYSFNFKWSKSSERYSICFKNIVANKANYIGQPFSVFLAKMPIGIKYFEPSRGLPHNKNAEPSTQLLFYFPQNISELNKTFPKLEIVWEPILNRTTSASLFTQYRGAWSSLIASHYNSAVISDIIVITGLNSE